MWTTPILSTLCSHCQTAPVQSYAPQNCFDPTYKCYETISRTVPCTIPGTPPIPSACSFWLLEECDTDTCVDEDGDGYFGDGPWCPQGDDCDDDDPEINPDPNTEEDCDDEGNVDENCNGKVNCEEASCRDELGKACDEECDKDGDGYYSLACDGEDCKDDPEDEPNAANIFPGQDVENTAELCDDELNNDCDSDTDCEDSDCRSPEEFCPQCLPAEICVPGNGDSDCNGLPDCDDPACSGTPNCPAPTPTPTPDPGPGPEPTPECPCNDCTWGCGCECNDCINGCEPDCEWVIIEGQCYAGWEYCTWEEDAYGVWWYICEGEEPYCDPDQTVWVCE